MADFPTAITTPRTVANRPGVVFDADDTKTFFAEDLNNANDEIVAIETDLLTNQRGWAALGACTYEGADAPTYTISFASDMTAILGLGMRIKLTDSTVKYFIITAVGAYSGGKTIITIYGGTDYALTGGAITLPYYSIQKAPFGFPLNPIKWTVEVICTSVNQAGAVSGTWYNLGTKLINIPIGCWRVDYNAEAGLASSAYIFATLSASNNSESDSQFTSLGYFLSDNRVLSRYKFLILTTKTPYYFNFKTVGGGTLTIYTNGNTSGLIRAVCAYL